jgi:uncharacterized protein YkwD
MRVRRQITARSALATLLCACASGGSAVRPDGATVHFSAAGPGANQYQTEPTSGDALRGPHALRVGRGIVRAAQDRAHPLAPDARLGDLAERVAGALDAQGSPPPFAAIDLWTHHLGLFEPAPHLLVLSQGDAATLEDRVATEVASLLPLLRYTHYGAATLEKNGSVFAVIVLSWRWAQLAPLPRAVEPGTSLELKGRLLDNLGAAQLVVSFPDGTSYRSQPQTGTEVALSVPTRGRGEQRVELLASSATLGETVVANFPIYVGVAPATEVTTQAELGSGAQLDEQQSSERLLVLINRDRRTAGLAPLAPEGRLARVARAHSVDMEQHAFVGHTSPTTGNAEDRVRRAGIRTPVVLENIGRGYGADEVHRGLMESPGHRENVLSPHATHVGIGVIVSPEDQRNAYLVTEVFARFAAKIDVAAAPALLLSAVNRERERRGLRALVPDKAMAVLCDEAAHGVFVGAAEPRQQTVERLNSRAAKAHPPYARLGALLTLVTALEDATRLDGLLDPAARAVGLGIAQGTRSETIENAIAVVALVGY